MTRPTRTGTRPTTTAAPRTGNGADPALTLNLDAGELPAPGEDVLIVHGAYEVLVAHTGEPEADVDETAEEPGSLLSFSVVDVHGASRVHAAVVRQRAVRSVVDRHPLCSRSRTRKVARRRRDLDLSTVNCTQCAARLRADGIL